MILPARGKIEPASLLRGVQNTEMFLAQPDEFLVVDTASSSQDHSRCVVMRSNVRQKISFANRSVGRKERTRVHQLTFWKDSLDVLRRSKNGSSQRCALVSGGMQMVEGHFLKIVLDLLHLTQNGVTLEFDLLLTKSAVLNNVR